MKDLFAVFDCRRLALLFRRNPVFYTSFELIVTMKMLLRTAMMVQAFAVASCTATKNSMITSDLFLPKSATMNSNTFLSSSSSSQSFERALLVRGGAGPLPTDFVAKAATVMVGIDSAFNIVAPDTAMKSIGLPSSPFLKFKHDAIGFVCAFHALTAACILFGKTSINTAIGAGLMFLNVFHFKTIMTGVPQVFGFPAIGQYLSIAINGFTSYGIFTDAPYVSTLVKVVSGWMALNGVGLVANVINNPIWGFQQDSPSPDHNAFFDKFLGYSMIAAATYCGLLVSGMDSLKALGYSCVPSLFNTVSQNFITKEVQRYGLAKGQQMFSLVILTVIVGTLAV